MCLRPHDRSENFYGDRNRFKVIYQLINRSVLSKVRSFAANSAFSILPTSQPSFSYLHTVNLSYCCLSSDIFFCLELSSHLPYLPEHPSFSRQFLLSQWPSQFLFLFLISSSIILPSPTLSSTTAFLFCLSILHAPSLSIPTSQMLPVVFAHSVVVSMSLHHRTLHYTQKTSLVSSVVLSPRACRKCFFFC